jgi:hypothetical protein
MIAVLRIITHRIFNRLTLAFFFSSLPNRKIVTPDREKKVLSKNLMKHLTEKKSSRMDRTFSLAIALKINPNHLLSIVHNSRLN